MEDICTAHATNRFPIWSSKYLFAGLAKYANCRARKDERPETTSVRVMSRCVATQSKTLLSVRSPSLNYTPSNLFHNSCWAARPRDILNAWLRKRRTLSTTFVMRSRKMSAPPLSTRSVNEALSRTPSPARICAFQFRTHNSQRVIALP